MVSAFLSALPRFFSFLFLSTCLVCLVAAVPSMEWLVLEPLNRTFGIFGVCSKDNSEDNFSCTAYDWDFLNNLALLCDSAEPPYGRSPSSCRSRISQWRISQAFSILSILAATAGATILAIEGISAVRAVSFRVTKCCGRRVEKFATALSWLGIIITAITCATAISAAAVSHSLFDRLINDLDASSIADVESSYRWPWFSSVAAASFSSVSLIFAILFNNPAQLRAALQPLSDPELTAYEDADYTTMRVGSGFSSHFKGAGGSEHSLAPYENLTENSETRNRTKSFH